ncbi:MAG: tetratricopeptide repeat protein [Holosporaceae bacterium]
MPSLLQEIKEELQNEAWQKALMKYGPYVAGLLITTLLILGGYLWFNAHQQSKAEYLSATYDTALDAIDKGDFQTAQPLLEKIAKKTGNKGYGVLAQLSMVALAHKKALATLDPEWVAYWNAKATEVVNLLEERYESSFSTCLKLATAYGLLDFPHLVPAKHLDELQTPQSPWFGLAGEVVFLQTLIQTLPTLEKDVFSGKTLTAPLLRQPQILDERFYKTFLSPFTSADTRARLEFLTIAMGRSYHLKGQTA